MSQQVSAEMSDALSCILLISLRSVVVWKFSDLMLSQAHIHRKGSTSVQTRFVVQRYCLAWSVFASGGRCLACSPCGRAQVCERQISGHSDSHRVAPSSLIRGVPLKNDPLIFIHPTSAFTSPSGQGVFGSCGPGDMLALLGPSGSGKSTLLDILAMRKSTGALGGTVTVNGAPRVSAEFLRLSAYVPQVGASTGGTIPHGPPDGFGL